VDQVHSWWTEAEGPVHHEPQGGADGWSGGASLEVGDGVEWAENGSAGPDGGWAATKEKPGKIIRNGVGCKAVLGQK
jgi:hypothetical protein